MLQVSSFLKRNYSPLNLIELSAENIKDNYNYLSKIDNNIKVAPVLKSNAYGHGIKLMGKELDKLNLPFLCVDSLYEAYELKNANIKSKILIMGNVHPNSLNTKKLPFSFAVHTKEAAQALDKHQPEASVHIFVDTGMHREGISIQELPDFVEFIKGMGLKVEGLMSHFGMSDKPSDSKTKEQLINFRKAKEILSKGGIFPQWIHISNSSGLLNSKNLKGELGNMARVGLATYGIDPEGKNSILKPVLTLTTQVSQVKNLPKGEGVGYDFTFVAPKDMTIAILPIGYNDGVDRRLSGKGFVSFENTLLPIMGRISMNITVVDVSDTKIKSGDTITVFSNVSSNSNSIQNSATICKAISYDLLVHLFPSTKRVIV